jgi:hypothetical protein
MAPPHADTDPAAMEAWLAALRKLTPGEKFALVIEMMEMQQDASARQIRAEHPEFSQRDVLPEIAARCYGRELAERAYPMAKGATG